MTLKEFVKRLKRKKAKGYLVGGAVRDKQKNEKPKDNDYCVTGLSKEEFEALFPEAQLNGPKRIVVIDGVEQEVEFPVYRFEIEGEICEVALGRKDFQFGPTHNDVMAIPDANMKIEDDLARRDITINSMAIDLETSELIDPFNGKADLESGIIRKTTDAFKEDPLRVYRAARFASQFGFEIEKQTLADMTSLKGKLHREKMERIMEETKKALLSNKPSAFFRMLKKADILGVHFPELDCLSQFEQNPEFHPEGNVFEHTMQVLDAARQFARCMLVIPGETIEERKERELRVMLAALTHDFGKRDTQGIHKIKGTPTYIRHELAGVPIAEVFLNRLNLQSAKPSVLVGTAKHMMFKDVSIMKASKVVDLLEGKFEPRGLKEIEKTHAADLLKKKGLNPKQHINKVKVYERESGIQNSMGIEEYIALCSSDIAGRVKNPERLLEVVAVFLEAFQTDQDDITIIADKLFNVIDSPEEAERMKADLLMTVKHRKLLQEYAVANQEVKNTLDVESLSESYKPYLVYSRKGKNFSIYDAKNIDAGYKIHSSKKQQRTKIIENIKNLQMNQK